MTSTSESVRHFILQASTSNHQHLKQEPLHQFSGRPSFCEWKGLATYWDLSRSNGESIRQKAGWSYDHPDDRYSALKAWIAFIQSQLIIAIWRVRR